MTNNIIKKLKAIDSTKNTGTRKLRLLAFFAKNAKKSARDDDRKAYHSILVDNLEILRQSRPMASKALQTESLGRDTFQAGTFWDLLWRSAKYFLAWVIF